MSAKENVQSYSSFQSEVEGVGSLQSTPNTSNETVNFDDSAELAAQIPPQHLPRRKFSPTYGQKECHRLSKKKKNESAKVSCREIGNSEVRTRSKSAHNTLFPPIN